jgi:TonB family protein
MFTVTAPKFRVTATAFAASLLGTALVFAVPQAAQAATTNSDFVRVVESQLGRDSFAPANTKGVATVAVRIDADGKIRSAEIAQSSGHRALDRAALASAKSVHYPKGSNARTVAVVLRFGDVELPAKAESASLVSRYVNAKGEALASQSTSSPVG